MGRDGPAICDRRMSYDKARHNEAAARSRARARGEDVPYLRQGPAFMDPLERLLRHVDASGDCWEWTASTTHGYGRFSRQRSHRALYEMLVGPVPEGLELDHLCRNRACVNPDHLEPVTRRVNVLRSPLAAGARARQTHCHLGHEFTPANTLISRRNQRECRACRRRRGNESQRRRRLASRSTQDPSVNSASGDRRERGVPGPASSEVRDAPHATVPPGAVARPGREVPSPVRG